MSAYRLPETFYKWAYQDRAEHNEVVLINYQPPMVSFEVRGRVEIHEEGVYHQFMNAQPVMYITGPTWTVGLRALPTS